MIGGIAEAYYGPVDPNILDKVKTCLTEELWQITRQFCNRYKIGEYDKGIAPGKQGRDRE
jgi:hypothetical protein